jgi:hypothetical protein
MVYAVRLRNLDAIAGRGGPAAVSTLLEAGPAEALPVCPEWMSKFFSRTKWRPRAARSTSGGGNWRSWPGMVEERRTRPSREFVGFLEEQWQRSRAHRPRAPAWARVP